MSNHKSTPEKQKRKEDLEAKELVEEINSQVAEGAELKGAEQITANCDTLPVDNYIKACEVVYECRVNLLLIKTSNPVTRELIAQTINRPDVVEMANEVSLFGDVFEKNDQK